MMTYVSNYVFNDIRLQHEQNLIFAALCTWLCTLYFNLLFPPIKAYFVAQAYVHVYVICEMRVRMICLTYGLLMLFYRTAE